MSRGGPGGYHRTIMNNALNASRQLGKRDSSNTEQRHHRLTVAQAAEATFDTAVSRTVQSKK